VHAQTGLNNCSVGLCVSHPVLFGQLQESGHWSDLSSQNNENTDLATFLCLIKKFPVACKSLHFVEHF